MEIDVGSEKYNMKYILLWTTVNNSLSNIGDGQTPFIDHACLYTNCFLTTDKYLLNEDYINFDALIFDVNDLRNWNEMTFPETRSLHQKYIFHSDTSSYDAPICNYIADNYFNWTWTYKLNSDIVNPFIEIKDFEGNVLAPKESVAWESNITEVTEEEIKFFKEKRKTMAWIVSKCNTVNDRMMFAKMLRSAFQKNSLVFDIYGCGYLECPKGGCLEIIKKEYYFYFAAEESNTEDYVTDEVITAYSNYAVPIVFGGANYSKFLPQGSYLNARSTGFEQLIALIQYILKNPEIYYHFHRWRKHYTINKTERYKGICEICAYLNDEGKFKTVSIKEDFRKWWYSGILFQRCIPKEFSMAAFSSDWLAYRRDRLFAYSGALCSDPTSLLRYAK
ncbi:unnamed protein product, partial [Brenthis ino]